MARRLRVSFEQPADFRAEFDRNIAKGGVFVPGVSGLELREVVEVELELAFAQERRTLEAEVVHVASEGGVAVQLLRTAAELREDFAAVLAHRDPPTTPFELPDLELDAFEQTAAPIELAAPEPEEPALDLDDLEGDLFETGDPVLAAPPEVGAERRRAPRARARVPARLEGGNASVVGVTRDLSVTGALISADASELPPGKQVTLQLRNLVTGDPFEVSGRVARHVETPGTVAAVSIDFDVPAEQKSELAALVEAAAHVHKQRAAAGISGRIEELGVASLIQMLGSSSPHGTLSLSRGNEEGVLAFEAGTLRYVRLGATRGLKALTRVLEWRDGTFEFHAQVDPLEQEDQRMGLEAALLEATRRIDEAAQMGTPDLDPAARFSVDRAALARVGVLEKVQEAVVELATAGFTVRRILDVVPEADAEVSRALAGLVAERVLLPQG